jgi:hypothetical protein
VCGWSGREPAHPLRLLYKVSALLDFWFCHLEIEE